jgi:predicted ribosomally synthesized peptide with nif11-like leader
MATSTAKDLIKKMASDKAFRQSLESAPTKEARVALLAKSGFGDVTLNHVRGLAKAEGMQLTDEQLLAVAGNMGGVARPVEWAKVVVAAAALFV